MKNLIYIFVLAFCMTALASCSEDNISPLRSNETEAYPNTGSEEDPGGEDDDPPIVTDDNG